MKAAPKVRWPTWPQRRKTLKELLDYEPTEPQLRAHKSSASVKLVAGGERAGKSAWTAYEVLSRIPAWQRVALVAQKYDETRRESEYVLEGLKQLGLLVGESTPAKGPWKMELPGERVVQSISLKDGPRALTGTGQPFDIVAMCEAGRIVYAAFLAAQGRTAETRGMIILSGTLWDNFGWYADLYQRFQGPNRLGGETFSFPTWSNTHIFPKGRQDPKIKEMEATYPPEEFARLVAAELVASPARIYPEFSFDVHVKKCRYDRDKPVYVSIDPGYYPSKYAVLAMQIYGGGDEKEEVHVIDEIWENQKVHTQIINIAKKRAWWSKVVKIIGGHETSQHAASESTAEVWKAKATPPFYIADKGSVQDGIVRVKTFLSDPERYDEEKPDKLYPRLFFDVSCTGCQEEMQSYKRRTDREGNVLGDDAMDENNDLMDALRNFLVERYGYVERPTPAGQPGRKSVGQIRG